MLSRWVINTEGNHPIFLRTSVKTKFHIRIKNLSFPKQVNSIQFNLGNQNTPQLRTAFFNPKGVLRTAFLLSFNWNTCTCIFKCSFITLSWHFPKNRTAHFQHHIKCHKSNQAIDGQFVKLNIRHKDSLCSGDLLEINLHRHVWQKLQKLSRSYHF
jgi:hypothetical protein